MIGQGRPHPAPELNSSNRDAPQLLGSRFAPASTTAAPSQNGFVAPNDGREYAPQRTSVRSRSRSCLHAFNGLFLTVICLVNALFAHGLTAQDDSSEIPMVTVSGLESSNLKLQLRAQWGGDSAIRWSGRMWLSNGEIQFLNNLCLDPMSPGSKYIEQGQLLFAAPNPIAYDGMDFEINAPDDAILNIEFERFGAATSFVEQVKIADLVQDRFSKPLENGHVFIMQRTSFDRLQFKFAHPSLVFETGESTQFDLIPRHAELEPNTAYEVAISLSNVASQEEKSSLKLELTSDDLGNLEPLEGFELVIPPLEGAYNLQATVTPKKTHTPFVRPRSVLEATIQFVAVDPKPINDVGTPFEPPFEIDPAKPGWWDRLRALPQLRVLPGLSKAPMGNGKSRLVTRQDETWTELEVGGWVAYPLPLKTVGHPYLIEVEYDSNRVQQLGISIVEPNSAGRFAALGIDMGVDVQSQLPSDLRPNERVSAQWFQAVVWPNTSAPLLVLHNLNEKSPARFGRIRISMGSGRLPSPGSNSVAVTGIVSDESSPEGESTENLGIGTTNQSTSASFVSNSQPQPISKRMVATYLDTPLFPDSFSAPERYDASSDRTHDDWYSFWLGGRRLIEHLRYQGESAAVLTVLSEGSSLYNSEHLQPTPKYDSGAFLSNGQDPYRKDVLEMLFRLFDRESMTLIPQIEFASPLPAVEAKRRRIEGTTNINDLLLLSDVDVFQRNGYSSTGRYNPLSPDVQAAMKDVVKELCERYGHHPSFGGISIRIDDHTFTHFPDDRYGYDFETVSRFLKANTNYDSNGASDENESAYQRYVQLVRERPQAWLEWRQQMLTNFYQQLADVVVQRDRNARLYLSVADIFRDSTSVRLMHPSIHWQVPELDRVLLGKGLALQHLKYTPGVTVLSPYRLAPLEPLATSRVERHLEATGVLQNLTQTDAVYPGSMVYQVTKPYLLDELAEKSPYAKTQESSLLFPQLVGSDAQLREPFALRLAQQDQMVFFEGGMMAIQGQRRALGEFFYSFEQLPAVVFEDVPVGTASSRQKAPIVFRKKTIGGKTYAYAVNQSPWRVVVDMTVRGDGPIQGQDMLGNALPIIPDRGNPAMIQLTLEPFDLKCMEFESEAIEFPEIGTRYHDPTQIAASINEDLRLFQSELELAAGNPIVWNVIGNSGFEDANTQAGIAEWETAQGDSISIRRVKTSNAHEGSHAIELSSNGQQFAWMRSKSFAAPTSGRLSISVWLKLPANEKQPPLRLAIEGNHMGQEYYRFAEVGELARGDSSRQLGTEWKRFGVHFDDLPPEGLSQLRIGFDLMGPGTVWIDQVEVYDLWLDNDDVIALASSRLNLHDALQRGDYVECFRFLESYWSQVLLHEPSTRRDNVIETADQRAAEQSGGFSRSLIEKMKGLAPQKVLRLR